MYDDIEEGRDMEMRELKGSSQGEYEWDIIVRG